MILFQEIPEVIKFVPNGKRPNGLLAANGHIPLASASTTSASPARSMKAKLIESDDVSFTNVSIWDAPIMLPADNYCCPGQSADCWFVEVSLFITEFSVLLSNK